MDIRDARRRVCDEIRAAIHEGHGEELYERILSGHTLMLTEEWFASFLFKEDEASPRRSRNREPVARTPMDIMSQVVDVARRYVKTPAVEVECGLGSNVASLGLTLGIDRNPRKLSLARRAFPDRRFENLAIGELPDPGAYCTIIAFFCLGPQAMVERHRPVFQDFFRNADRLLKPGGRIIIADRDQFQDNVIEPQVALEYEIMEVCPIKGSGQTVVVTEK